MLNALQLADRQKAFLPIEPNDAQLPPFQSKTAHRGIAPLNTNLHQAIAFSKPLTASGLRAPLYDSGVGPRCTGKERDSETGLDYFLARYYSSAQGRFASPDPHVIVQESRAKLVGLASDPRNWNAYSYVLNNPLALVDPDGREPNKAQAVTAAQLLKVVRVIERSNPTALPKEVLHLTAVAFQQRYDVLGNPRYVFTKKDGWIDAKHFFTAADETTRRGAIATKALGYALEIQQSLKLDPSGFSYEDLGSNSAGAAFGKKVNNQFQFSLQVSEFFSSLSPTAPEEAPNWSAVPDEPSTNRGRASQSTNGAVVPASTGCTKTAHECAEAAAPAKP